MKDLFLFTPNDDDEIAWRWLKNGKLLCFSVVGALRVSRNSEVLPHLPVFVIHMVKYKIHSNENEYLQAKTTHTVNIEHRRLSFVDNFYVKNIFTC